MHETPPHVMYPCDCFQVGVVVPRVAPSWASPVPAVSCRVLKGPTNSSAAWSECSLDFHNRKGVNYMELPAYHCFPEASVPFEVPSLLERMKTETTPFQHESASGAPAWCGSEAQGHVNGRVPIDNGVMSSTQSRKSLRRNDMLNILAV